MEKLHVELTNFPHELLSDLLQMIPEDTICWTIPEEVESRISDLIEDGKYDEAEKLIEKVEKDWGTSTFTVKLNARLNTWRILGEE